MPSSRTVGSFFRQAVIDGLTIAIVTGLSLMLLLYVAYGEASRTYQQFQIGKLTAQGTVVQKAIEEFLKPGLPMRQFVGFKAMTDRVIASDRSIVAIAAFDQSDQPIFENGAMAVKLLGLSEAAAEKDSWDRIDLREDGELLQIVLPLRNKFERVGSLAFTVPRGEISQRVNEEFRRLLPMLVGAVVAFAVFVAIAGSLLGGRQRRWLQIGFAIVFGTMSVAVISTLITVYSDGAKAKTRALASSLAQRLTIVVEAGVNIGEVDGLQQVFQDYLRLNPDIASAGVIVDGKIANHSDAALVGTPFIENPATLDMFVDLTRPGGRKTELIVEMHPNVIYRQITRSIKNFTALFVASAFMAGLFLQLAGTVRRKRLASDTSANDGFGEFSVVALVKPVFFLTVFVEHLTYAFLPQFLDRLITASGLPTRMGSLLFMTYFLAFALTLVPAGHFAQTRGTRPLMVLGLALAAAGFAILAWRPDFMLVLLARALSGIGQGMVFIGVQSYILAGATPDRRTQGAGIIVFGYQGGMISGMAIGSLLVSQIGPSGVFTIGALVGAAMILYTLAVVPPLAARAAAGSEEPSSVATLFRELGIVLRNGDFLRTILLIGMPAKAVLTGVVIFALPLLMDRAGYIQEDIGQVLMVYAGAVIVASAFVSRKVDRHGRAETMLFFGAVLSGIGLLMISIMDGASAVDLRDNATMRTVILIVGVGLVGIAHGFINAPVVTHVASSPLAATVGESALTATYRFVERAGHIAGPLIVGQLLLMGGRTSHVIGWIGFLVIMCGIIFYVQTTYRQLLHGKEVA
jgi:MFS family permease